MAPLYTVPWHPSPAHVLNQAASIDVMNSCPDPSSAWPVLSLRSNGFPALSLLSERHLVALKKLQRSQDSFAERGRWRVWSVTGGAGLLFIPDAQLAYTRNNHTEIVLIKLRLGPLVLASYWLPLTS